VKLASVQAVVRALDGAGPVRVVSVPTLIAMKEAAGREEDRADIRHLRLRLEDP